MENVKKIPSLSKQALRRLPEYLSLLQDLQEQGVQTVSAPAIARQLHYGEVQVRKDLAAVSSEGGKPKTGFEVEGLIRDLTSFLGFNNTDSAVLVGAGHLGRALLSYDGFEACGVKILAAFDADPSLADTTIHGNRFSPLPVWRNCAAAWGPISGLSLPLHPTPRKSVTGWLRQES